MTKAEREELIRLRNFVGTQDEVAALIGVHPNTISNYERGDPPRWYTDIVLPELGRRKMAGMIGVDPEDVGYRPRKAGKN